MKIISYKKIFALGTLMMFGAACEVTDLQPIDALSETTAYETLERVELAVTGVYDGAQSGFYAVVLCVAIRLELPICNKATAVAKTW